ncbi:hypothetical protein LOAG_15443 [Loa loa]|uniref:Uncharacterized protein n=1 Tax=Loa loa TaxID=7209 RepID=A0A1S0TG94_LOALO|nr:hypothetical protein LOAG_15443 [Loa loa]EFO13088.1 hypothetical protein LOAG_15443 [Loa loa]
MFWYLTKKVDSDDRQRRDMVKQLTFYSKQWRGQFWNPEMLPIFDLAKFRIVEYCRISETLQISLQQIPCNVISICYTQNISCEICKNLFNVAVTLSRNSTVS